MAHHIRLGPPSNQSLLLSWLLFVGRASSHRRSSRPGTAGAGAGAGWPRSCCSRWTSCGRRRRGRGTGASKGGWYAWAGRSIHGGPIHSSTDLILSFLQSQVRVGAGGDQRARGHRPRLPPPRPLRLPGVRPPARSGQSLGQAVSLSLSLCACLFSHPLQDPLPLPVHTYTTGGPGRNLGRSPTPHALLGPHPRPTVRPLCQTCLQNEGNPSPLLRRPSLTHIPACTSALAERTSGFSGADLANVLRCAALHALSTTAQDKDVVPSLTLRDVEEALRGTRPSTTATQVERYRAFAARHRGQGRMTVS